VGLPLHPPNEQASNFSRAGYKELDMEVKSQPPWDFFWFAGLNKDKVRFKRNVEFPRIARKQRQEEKWSAPFKDSTRRRPMLKELQKKKYPFPYSYLSGMLDNLLEKGVIQLPEAKRSEEVKRTTTYYIGSIIG